MARRSLLEFEERTQKRIETEIAMLAALEKRVEEQHLIIATLQSVANDLANGEPDEASA